MADRPKVAKAQQLNNPFQDLVVAILSVNNYTLEQTYRSIQDLRKQGLFDPQNLVQWDRKEIVAHLKAGGYDRGSFMTNLFALRLNALGEYVRGRLDTFAAVLGSRDAKTIEEFLLPVNGIGPKVLFNFFLLREIEK